MQASEGTVCDAPEAGTRARIFALSDLHVDHGPNLAWLQALSSAEYTDDVLILAGDVSDGEPRMELALTCLLGKFRRVFFVPGNHDLWVRSNGHAHSLDKFHSLTDKCEALGIATRPAPVTQWDGRDVWIVPLFSWYTRPEEGEDSLFGPKPGEDPTLNGWRDNTHVRWPRTDRGTPPCRYFHRLNEPHTHPLSGRLTISFSHFLPRQDLMRGERRNGRDERRGPQDPHPKFNFSRVAGSSALEDQLRRLKSCIHVYGHQHRNRDRTIDGIRYVSHCLGYPRERHRGYIRGMEEGPLLI